ncbi:MAG: hypothetical protein ORN98_09405 [Alphaproteobacteria bacterium]|nr:hypothetical protein [Alphaproteobacteria bacterium]
MVSRKRLGVTCQVQVKWRGKNLSVQPVAVICRPCQKSAHLPAPNSLAANRAAVAIRFVHRMGFRNCSVRIQRHPAYAKQAEIYD